MCFNYIAQELVYTHCNIPCMVNNDLRCPHTIRLMSVNCVRTKLSELVTILTQMFSVVYLVVFF